MVVKAISHRQVFRQVACRLIVALGLDAVPRLGCGKQGRADVTSPKKNHSLNALHHLLDVSTVIGLAFHDIGILLQQNTILVHVFGLQFRPVIIKSAWTHLVQNHRNATRSLHRLDGPRKIVGRLLPCNSNPHSLLALDSARTHHDAHG